MKDIVYDDMIVVSSRDDDDEPEPSDEEKQLIDRIVDATADTFSRVSYLMREIRDGLDPELRPAFREIVGAALRAHGDVVCEMLPEENRRFMITMAERLAERAIDALGKRIDEREAEAKASRDFS